MFWKIPEYHRKKPESSRISKRFKNVPECPREFVAISTMRKIHS
jgi:hypothetical protein